MQMRQLKATKKIPCFKKLVGSAAANKINTNEKKKKTLKWCRHFVYFYIFIYIILLESVCGYYRFKDFYFIFSHLFISLINIIFIELSLLSLFYFKNIDSMCMYLNADVCLFYLHWMGKLNNYHVNRIFLLI